MGHSARRLHQFDRQYGCSPLLTFGQERGGGGGEAAGGGVRARFFEALARYDFKGLNTPIDFAAELMLFERPPFHIEPITVDDLRLLDRLDAIPELHDRLMAAVALRVGASILTCDPLISACPEVHCIW